MGYMMKAWDIVGFTGDADYWCVGCAHDRYGVDDDGIVDAVDGEGNVVFPVFVSDDYAGAVCGGCGGGL